MEHHRDQDNRSEARRPIAGETHTLPLPRRAPPQSCGHQSVQG
ncbi:unnamed protein product [Staurois parvus]|nr:unnamed protein product [Staurois parvus]